MEEAHGLLLVLAHCDAHYCSHMSNPILFLLSYSQELCLSFGIHHLQHLGPNTYVSLKLFLEFGVVV